MKNIAFVFAHPDDLAHAAAGTAMLLSKKFNIHAICATKGERGIAGASLQEAATIREKEQKKESKLMGAKLSFLGLIDGEVFASKENSEKLAALLKKIKPVAVFTMWPVDWHHDHAAISDMTRKALRIAGMLGSAELFYFPGGLGSQTVHFNPEIYIDVARVHEKKLEMVRTHKCQNTNDSLLKSSEFMSAVFAAACGLKHAEGFIMGRSIPANKGNFLSKNLSVP
ncbi:MAG: hypothetical protein A2X49_16925 [Lentisphaerae bacterium GWF2_52_8]|nr:MAG: hypothetical protein A2X49_16925 [Lentisphaerae bacterium GWF2_52_8]